MANYDFQQQWPQKAYWDNAYYPEAYAHEYQQQQQQAYWNPPQYQEAYTPGVVPAYSYPGTPGGYHGVASREGAGRTEHIRTEHAFERTGQTVFRHEAAGAPAPKDEDYSYMTSWKMLLVLGFLVLAVLVASGLVIYLSGRKSGGDATDVDLNVPGDRRRDPATVEIYIRPPQTTTPRTPLPAQPPMRNSPLICVYGGATNESVEFPDDGLCEFTFYEGLYGPGQPELHVVNMLASEGPLRNFASQAALHSSTQYGLSLRYGAQAQVAQHVESERGRWNIAQLWNSKIRHYGFLNIDFQGFDVNEFRNALVTLRVLDSTLQRLRAAASEAAYLGVGFYVFPEHRDRVSDAFTAVYTPSFIVAHGHIGFDDRPYGDRCVIYPPTVLNGAGLYEPSQMKALQMLGELNNDTFALAVSVAMFGRKYLPVAGGGLRIGTECTNHPDDYLVPYEVLCTNAAFQANVQEDNANAALFSYDDDARWVVTFDNERTLRRKLCAGKARNLDLAYGVAVYGMEYSDYTIRCPDLSTHGAYTRLLMVKKVRDFLVANFRASVDEGGCEQIQL